MIPIPQIRGLDDWRPLARGGLAVVWQAREVATDRQVAVKVYEHGLHELDPRHFLQESSAASRLRAHPGIVTTYSRGLLPDARPYLVMELCPGGSLTRWLEPENRPTPDRVRQVGVQVADTLAAAHAVGLLHRDIKPANILIDRDGKPRLADFGLTIRRGAESGPLDECWMTPAWAPPEAFRRQPASEAGDVYSLAATLYALLTGVPPRPEVGSDTPIEQVLDIVQTPIRPVPGSEGPLMDVLLEALDDDPEARPSAATFFAKLARVPLHTSKRGVLVGAVATARAHAHPASAERPVSPPARGNGLAELPGERDTVAPAPAPEAPPEQDRRRGLLVLVAALAVVLVAATAWLVRDPTVSASPAPATQSAGAGAPASTAPSTDTAPVPDSPSPAAGGGTGGQASPTSFQARSIRLVGSDERARPFQAARIEGTYAGGADTFLRVQRWEEGAWQTFPVPTKTDASGRFTAYVEIGRPGRYRLRVVDPSTGVRSEPMMLVVAA